MFRNKSATPFSPSRTVAGSSQAARMHCFLAWKLHLWKLRAVWERSHALQEGSILLLPSTAAIQLLLSSTPGAPNPSLYQADLQAPKDGLRVSLWHTGYWRLLSRDWYCCISVIQVSQGSCISWGSAVRQMHGARASLCSTKYHSDLKGRDGINVVYIINNSQLTSLAWASHLLFSPRNYKARVCIFTFNADLRAWTLFPELKIIHLTTVNSNSGSNTDMKSVAFSTWMVGFINKDVQKLTRVKKATLARSEPCLFGIRVSANMKQCYYEPISTL